MRETVPPDLGAGVQLLPGVGPERARLLQKLEIRTVGDLLLHRPHRYEDRRQVCPIAQAIQGAPVVVHGQVVALGVKRFRARRRSVFELILEDPTGRLHCRWWDMPFMGRYFKTGDDVFAYGKVTGLKPRTIDHPETEVVEPGEDASIHLHRLVPIYPLTEGLPQRWLRTLIWRTLAQCAPHLAEPWPAADLGGAISFAEALRWIHFPEELPQVELARRRLALDELLQLQVALQRRRRILLQKAQSPRCAGDNHLIRPFLRQLAFQLTSAQTTVLRHVRADLLSGRPMRRLLQGDVGSGKTVVAACAALMALESGQNVVLMAPTEVLAAQHYENFKRWLDPLSVSVHLHTGPSKTLAADQSSALLAPASDHASQPVSAPEQPVLVIGTHALVQAGFSLPRLGLVIIDEQHKFGVAQREQLVRKGSYPHLLLMTATPIPRTLGLTIYGDLDISVLDEMPAGRGRVETLVRPASALRDAIAQLRAHLAIGRQAYFVVPRVEESPEGIPAITAEATRLQQQLALSRVGVLHGQLPSEAKQAALAGFRDGSIHVLMATSIIEVGLDVPNATMLIVQHAEQFGLAQLHQMRGRIARGAHDACCILLARASNLEAHQRLSILAQTNDGFRIAEADLRFRGPGELLGSEQSGAPRFRFADLAADLSLVEQARNVARTLVQIEQPPAPNAPGQGKGSTAA